MHAIRVLREDHDRIQALLERLPENGHGPPLLDALGKELAVHTLAEDNIFLPQVEDALEDSRGTPEELSDDALAETRDRIAEAYENHLRVRELLARGRAGDQIVEELAGLVGRQVEIEESLYPEAEKVLEEEDFERIGDLIEHCKWQVRGLAQARLASSSSFRP